MSKAALLVGIPSFKVIRKKRIKHLTRFNGLRKKPNMYTKKPAEDVHSVVWLVRRE